MANRNRYGLPRAVIFATRQWATMAAPDDPPPPAPAPAAVVVIPPAPPEPNPLQTEFESLRQTVSEMETRLASATEGNRQWLNDQITPALSRLENLEANARTGMENLASQLAEVRATLTQLSQEQRAERNPPEPDPEAEPEPETETPPPIPPDPNPDPNPSADADARPGAKPKRKRRVI